MILKLGMKHQEEGVYKVYINHDPRMNLTYFTVRWSMHLNWDNCQNVVSREAFEGNG